jgi:hypothetical protein
MRDIKSIRGDMFAHGVPFELVQELEEASKDEGAKCTDCGDIDRDCIDIARAALVIPESKETT